MSPPRSACGPGHVRIIGGRWRGTRLPVATIPGLRPSSDRTRETLFNWLQPHLPGARVLDLFAGSGALGLEALSRGAREALLVEHDPGLVETLRAAIERLGAGAQAHVLRADAVKLLRAPLHGRFDVVFVDPPFDAALWAPVIELLTPWLADNAWLYLETPVATPLQTQAQAPLPGAPWTLHRQGATRQARHALYRRFAGAAATLPPDSKFDGAATE